VPVETDADTDHLSPQAGTPAVGEAEAAEEADEDARENAKPGIEGPSRARVQRCRKALTCRQFRPVLAVSVGTDGPRPEVAITLGARRRCNSRTVRTLQHS
jgi:hypothetical protein